MSMLSSASVHAGSFAKVLAIDSTNATSFAAVADTLTEPDQAAGLVVDLTSGTGQDVPDWVVIVPYGTGAANNQFDVRVNGVRKSALEGAWTTVPLLQFTVTMGTKAGVAGGAVTDTNLYADTVSDPAAGIGVKGFDCEPTSPADDTVAQYFMKTRGYSKLRFEFKKGTGTPTGMNALMARL